MSAKILIGADIVPTESNIDHFSKGDVDYLIGDKLKARIQGASFVAMNLEVPLVDVKTPIRKCGPCLIASTESVDGIKQINPYFLTLANNHILDQGVEGLESTIKVLRDHAIDFSGVGKNLTEARKPYIREIGDIKVGIYCCAEHEYSIATDKTAGANPYDPLVSFDDVKELRKQCDYLIVLYHGGKEHYRYPSPMLQRIFHKFADSGADLIVAQHTHCIGCKEEYKGSTLVYGQGNFLFDHSDSEYWKTSLLIEINLENKSVGFIPLVKMNDSVREAEGEAKTRILNDFNTRNEEITKPDFVNRKYRQFAEEMEAEYLSRFSGSFCKNIVFRIINKMTNYRFIKRFYNQQYRMNIENVLDCEAHRELASQSMKGK